MHRARLCPVSYSGQECGKPVIASHSQQRRGPLKQIAEAGHVIGFSNGPNTKPSSSDGRELVRVSAKRASTFPGLCAEHDTTSFSEIENKLLRPGYRTSLALAIRCALYEAVVHTDGALFLNWLQTVPSFDFWIDVDSFTSELEHMIHYSRYNWDLIKLIQRIERRKSARKLYFYSALIDTALPFSATGCFCIENDVFGNQLQPFSEYGRKFSYAQLTVMPQANDTTLVSISSTDDKDKASSIRFVNSYRACKPNDLPNVILRTALEYTENIYFKPSWIESLSTDERRSLVDRFDDRVVFEAGQEKPKNSLSLPLHLSVLGTRVKQLSNAG
ncbi:hypothetical protein [Ruegeria sp.]|uniref:hypothetical protein n=1 Tax=Ruegeria sp. TaxID=1879320 RepID=UPI003AFF8158